MSGSEHFAKFAKSIAELMCWIRKECPTVAIVPAFVQLAGSDNVEGPAGLTFGSAVARETQMKRRDQSEPETCAHACAHEPRAAVFNDRAFA
jgi:hypothetical protein